MGNNNSLESNKSNPNGKNRRNSRVKDKYFSRFGQKKSKDNVFRKNVDYSENISDNCGRGELNILYNEIDNKELAHGIETTDDIDWGKRPSYCHDKGNVRREGSADTDTARDALLLDETPSSGKGITKYYIKNTFDEKLLKNTSNTSTSSTVEITPDNVIIYKVKSSKKGQQFNSKINSNTIKNLFKIDNNKKNDHQQLTSKENVDNDDMSLTCNSTLLKKSSTELFIKKKSPIRQSSSCSIIKFNVQPQNVANEDHLTTNDSCNVNEVEHTEKNGNLTAAVAAAANTDGIKATLCHSSNNLKPNEYGTTQNDQLSVIESEANIKKINLTKKLFNKFLLNKSEIQSSGSNIVIVQTDSWKLIENLQKSSTIDRQTNTTSENCENLDNCELIILKDSSESSESIFTDPLTPIGFTTELNECYMSEENICDDKNSSTNCFKSNYLSNLNQSFINEKLKQLSLSKVIFLNLGNDNNEGNNDSPEQDDLEMAIHLRNKLAQMLSSEEQKTCSNNNENGSIFNVSKSKKVELQNLSSRLPENSNTGQTAIKTSTVDNASSIPSTPEFETFNQQSMLTSTPSFFGSLTESNVLKKVATFITAEKSGNNVKLSDCQIAGKRPSLITEKLDFRSYDKFEGQMLMKWFTTTFQNFGCTLSEQELNNLTQQYCTNLLTIGVIKQISEKSEMESFNPFQMYQWTHRESPSTSVSISPGRLDADIKWPHSSKTINSPNKITKSTQSDIVRNKVETENYIENLTNEVGTPKLKSGIGGGDRKVYEIKKSLLNCTSLVELYEVVETLLPDRKPSTRLDQSTYYDADLNETEVTIFKLDNIDKNTDKIVESVDIALQTSFNEKTVCSRCENLRNDKTVATSPLAQVKCNQIGLKDTADIAISTKTSVSKPSSLNLKSFTAPPPPPPPPPLNMVLTLKPINNNNNSDVTENNAVKAKLNVKTPSPPPLNKNPCPPPPPPNCPPPPPSCPPPPPIPSSSVMPPPPPPVQNSNSQKNSSSGCPSPLPMPMPDGSWFQTNILRKNAVIPPKPMKPLYWTRIVTPKPATTPKSIEEKTETTPEEEEEVDQQQAPKSEVNEKPAELWQEIEETNLDNIDEFTDLFSRQAVIPRNKPEKKKINQIKTIKILDSKRSQNVGIFSRSLHFDFEEIEHAVYHCDTSVVNLETLQHIMSIKATPEELSQIREAATGSIPLDAPEQFLLRIAQISSSAERISCIVFQAEFDEGAIQISRKLEVVKYLSLFLTESDDLKLLFSIILTLGNYMNGGNRSRGQADGFGLEILGKLKDVKSKDSKITLLHFIVKTYIDRKRKLGTPLHELMLPIPDSSDVDKACAVDFGEVKQQITELNRKLSAYKITTEKVIRLSNAENIQPFKNKMEDFIEMGTKKIEKQFIKLDGCREVFLKTMKFYHFLPKSGTMDECAPGQFFEYWLNFTNDFKDIWKKEITFLSNELLKKMKSQHKIKKNGCNIPTDNKPNKVKPGSLKDRLLKMGKK